MQHIVYTYALCYNEAEIIPFFLDYCSKFTTKLIVYDNQSTDDSVKLLREETRFAVEVRTYDSHNQIDDELYIKIKNMCIQDAQGIADFAIVVDMDEFLYSSDWSKVFAEMAKYDACRPKWFELACRDMPEHKNGVLIHHQIDSYIDIAQCQRLGQLSMISSYALGKPQIINLKRVESIMFSPGQHSAICVNEIDGTKHHFGYVEYTPNDVYCFHANHVGIDRYTHKQLRNRERLSKTNIKNKYGIQYTRSSSEIAADIEIIFANTKKFSIE